MSAAELYKTALRNKINLSVSPESLHLFEPMMIQALDSAGWHHTQIAAILAENRKLVEGGMAASDALLQASEVAGPPAKERNEVWDERFRGRDMPFGVSA